MTISNLATRNTGTHGALDGEVGDVDTLGNNAQLPGLLGDRLKRVDDVSGSGREDVDGADEDDSDDGEQVAEELHVVEREESREAMRGWICAGFERSWMRI